MELHELLFKVFVYLFVCLFNNIFIEVWKSRLTKSSYETELRKIASHFELLTRKLL